MGTDCRYILTQKTQQNMLKVRCSQTLFSYLCEYSGWSVNISKFLRNTASMHTLAGYRQMQSKQDVEHVRVQYIKFRNILKYNIPKTKYTTTDLTIDIIIQHIQKYRKLHYTQHGILIYQVNYCTHKFHFLSAATWNDIIVIYIYRVKCKSGYVRL